MDEFDPKYVQDEESFRAKAAPLWDTAQSLKGRLRAQVDLSAEEREDRYRAGYESINRDFEELANDFAAGVEQERRALTQTVYGPVEDDELGTLGVADHLTSLAGAPDERLPELMRAARRAGEESLERAVAITALERDPFSPVFREWAEHYPQRADALQRLNCLPDSDRVRVRTLAMRPPKASAESLVPTQADYDEAADYKGALEASRRSFFGAPRHFVGRRSY